MYRNIIIHLGVPQHLPFGRLGPGASLIVLSRIGMRLSGCGLNTSLVPRGECRFGAPSRRLWAYCPPTKSFSSISSAIIPSISLRVWLPIRQFCILNRASLESSIACSESKYTLTPYHEFLPFYPILSR